MAFGSAGRFLFTDWDSNQVLVSTGGMPMPLFSTSSEPFSIAIDATDRIFTSHQNGMIQIYGSDGSIVDGVFRHSVKQLLARLRPRRAFGTGLYAFDGGNLVRLDAMGSATTVGSGFDPNARGAATWRLVGENDRPPRD